MNTLKRFLSAFGTMNSRYGLWIHLGSIALWWYLIFRAFQKSDGKFHTASLILIALLFISIFNLIAWNYNHKSKNR